MVTPNISLSKTERVMQAFKFIWQYRPELKGRYSETVASGLGALVRSASDFVRMPVVENKTAPLLKYPFELSLVDLDLDESVELADEDW